MEDGVEAVGERIRKGGGKGERWNGRIRERESKGVNSERRWKTGSGEGEGGEGRSKGVGRRR